MSKLPISIIVLSFNEEKIIEECLRSAAELSDKIFLVDSYSTDGTISIAKNYTELIYQHTFENYGLQRNWALTNLPIETEWVLNLDADHRITKELIIELKSIFTKGVDENINGFLISRRTIFLNRWIRNGGHYPTYHANLFRFGYGKCEERLYDQHFIVEGKVQKLSGDIIDIVSDSISNFVARHDRWATLEAIEQFAIISKSKKDMIKADIKGNEIERRRSLRNFYNATPLFIRPFLYFIYRYFLRLGFLDGREGLIFHVLQGFWYRFLVDAKIYQIESLAKKQNKPIPQVIKEYYGIDI